MTRVKICGITNVEDALCAIEAGADALGFVFYEKSPRYVEPLKVRRIVDVLPPFVTTVGLFVNCPAEKISRIMASTRLQVVQLHGDESPAECLLPPYQVIKALRMKNADSLKGAGDFPVSALLLDAWSGRQYGGSGSSFDWQLAAHLTGMLPLILAGGLTPDNVAEAISQVAPYGVDVSSGVEISPGRKDPGKINRFMEQVKKSHDL